MLKKVKGFLTVREVAKLLKVDQNTVYQYIQSKKLKFVRVSGHYRILASVAEDFKKKRIRKKTGYASGFEISKKEEVMTDVE